MSGSAKKVVAAVGKGADRVLIAIAEEAIKEGTTVVQGAKKVGEAARNLGGRKN